MAMQESSFQNLVLFFINDINATSKEILKYQSKQLALLEAIKDKLYEHNVSAVNELIEPLQEAYLKTSEMNIQIRMDLVENNMILPNSEP